MGNIALPTPHWPVLFWFCLWLSPATVQAQDINQRIADIGAGSYIVYQAGSHSFVQVYRGASGPFWVVDVVDGTDPNGSRLSREFRDARGQLVRVDYASGLSLRFNPHNCQRSVGACLFIQTGPDGDSQHGRLTTATADGYTYESSVFDRPGGNPVLAETGRIVLDAFGSNAAGQITAQDGTVTQVRLVQAVYR